MGPGATCGNVIAGYEPFWPAAIVDDALKQAPGANALVNVTSDAYSQFWILWSNTCTEIRGTAVTAN